MCVPVFAIAHLSHVLPVLLRMYVAFQWIFVTRVSKCMDVGACISVFTLCLAFRVIVSRCKCLKQHLSSFSFHLTLIFMQVCKQHLSSFSFHLTLIFMEVCLVVFETQNKGMSVFLFTFLIYFGHQQQ